jgi:hypothetical protein
VVKGLPRGLAAGKMLFDVFVEETLSAGRGQ